MILSILMFLVGMHLMIVLLAAGYRIIDLWYRIGDFWAGILAKIVGLILLEGILLTTLTGDALSGFVWGQLSYLVFHIVIFLMARMGIYIMEARRR